VLSYADPFSRASVRPRAPITVAIVWSVRLTEFWRRMDAVLGPRYSRTWASYTVISGLGERTVDQALEAGEPAKEIWRAVVDYLDLPKSER
jgi:Protein of unknown function (DUF3046)